MNLKFKGSAGVSFSVSKNARITTVQLKAMYNQVCVRYFKSKFMVCKTTDVTEEIAGLVESVGKTKETESLQQSRI